MAQFDLFETGYSFLICLQIPVFLDKLEDFSQSTGGYATLIQNYRHIIEWEFRGCQGLEDITADATPISNGITDINIITKVTEQGAGTFSMNYYERSGSILNKVNELFLRGIKDPKTQVKRYNGLLTAPFDLRNTYTTNSNGTTNDTGGAEQRKDELSITRGNTTMQESGYRYEIFHFLLIITDNTCLNVERAYLLACCQPTTSHTNIYNVTRGEIQFSELSLQFNGIPLPGRIVTHKAVEFLKYINDHTCFDEMEYGYQVMDEGEQANKYQEYVEKEGSGGAEIRSTTEKDMTVKTYTNKLFNSWGYNGHTDDKTDTNNKLKKAPDGIVDGPTGYKYTTMGYKNEGTMSRVYGIGNGEDITTGYQSYNATESNSTTTGSNLSEQAQSGNYGTV